MFGPFVFTHHLLPVLVSTAESSPPGTVRIINTASSGAADAPKDGIPITDPTVGLGASYATCYGYSKLVSQWGIIRDLLSTISPTL